MRISDWSSDVCSSDLDDCEPSKKTITEWTKAKNRFVEIFGDVKLTGVTRTHAHQFRAALRKLPKSPKQEIAKLPALKQIEKVEGQGHPLIKPATINKSLLWLKRMLNIAVDNGIIENNPADQIGRATSRERVGQNVSSSVAAVSLKK